MSAFSKRFTWMAIFVTLISMPVLAKTDSQLVIWHTFVSGDKQVFKENIQAFEKASGQRVKIVAIPFDAYADKITAAIPRGRGPDVFIYPQDRLGGWIESGDTVEPLSFYLNEQITSRFIPTTMEAMTYRNVVYGLPVSYNSIALIYNKALVKTPPTSTHELLILAKTLTKKSENQFGFAYDYANFYYHAPLFFGFGGSVFNDTAKPIINNNRNALSFDLLKRWIYGDNILPEEPSTALITSLFNQGKIGVVFSGPWLIRDTHPDIDVGVAILPTISEANNAPMRPWVTVNGAYISKQSQQKENAFKLIEYITRKESNEHFAIHGRQNPANKFAYTEAALIANPFLSTFRKQAETGIAMPNYAEMTIIWTHITKAIGQIVKFNKDSQAMLDDAQAGVETDWANLRKRY